MSEQQQQRQRGWTEELKLQGEALLGTVKGLAHEGNVRRVIIKDAHGMTLIEIPLSVGVVGALVAPVAAAVGAVAAMATDCSIVVERRENGASST